MRQYLALSFFTWICCYCVFTLNLLLAQSHETYPNRMVKIIVPYGAGGSLDALAGVFALGYTEVLGKSFIVENPSSGDEISLGMLARSSGDGFRLGLAATNMLTSNRFLFSNLPFDTFVDSVSIALIDRVPFILVAHSSIPADKSLTK